MIQWIRAKLYSGFDRKKTTGYVFQCGDETITFRRLGEGDYPPFDCLNLTPPDAIRLRDWLNVVLVKYVEETKTMTRERINNEKTNLELIELFSHNSMMLGMAIGALTMVIEDKGLSHRSREGALEILDKVSNSLEMAYYKNGSSDNE